MGGTNSIPSIFLQFHFSDESAIPPTFKKMVRNKEHVPQVRANHPKGLVAIESTHQCSVSQFIEDLAHMEYEMVNIEYSTRERPDPKDWHKKKIEHVVRVLFTHPSIAEPSSEFAEHRAEFLAELKQLCTKSLWRLRMFANPFYRKDGSEEVADKRSVSIDLDEHAPLYRENGKPVMIWERDAKGVALPRPPHRMLSEHNLRVLVEESDIIDLVSAKN